MVPDDVPSFMKTMLGCTTLEAARAFADEVMAVPDPERRRQMLIAGSQANPFFVPHIAGRQAAQLQGAQWVNAAALARMTAANANQDRVIVAAPMKSGSTFIADVVARALALPKVSLLVTTVQPYYFAVLGAGTRAHEIDELALLTACLNGAGFVAHHHMLCTPFLVSQAELYGLKFILLRRNIFDCIVSLDDFCRKNLSALANGSDVYLRMQLPPDWAQQPDEQRIRQLLDRFLPTYVNYYVSWKLLESQGLISPLWVSYEDELLAGKMKLASRLGDWLGKSKAQIDRLTSELHTGRDPAEINFNKGVAGRGKAIGGANRQRVLDTFNDFRHLADWSEILD